MLITDKYIIYEKRIQLIYLGELKAHDCLCSQKTEQAKTHLFQYIYMSETYTKQIKAARNNDKKL